jgi:hypothetical protein
MMRLITEMTQSRIRVGNWTARLASTHQLLQESRSAKYHEVLTRPILMLPSSTNYRVLEYQRLVLAARQ